MTSSPPATGDRRPPSRRIADDLREQITRGDYPPGGRLPSERELAGRYTTARNTAREAYGILQAEGLVLARHGRGVFVRARPPLMRLGADRYSRSGRQRSGLSPFRMEMLRQGRTPHAECRSITHIPAPPEVSQRLGLPSGAQVVARQNWYFADGEPVQHATTYLPTSIAAGTLLATHTNLGAGGIYARLEELGHQLATIRDEITARMPTPTEATNLHIPPGVPVIELLHTSIDPTNTPFETTKFILRADLIGLDYHTPTPE